MKIFLISDNVDTLEGMRLAGIEGVVVHTREEALEKLHKAEEDESIGLVLITQKLSKLCRDYIDENKLRNRPLIEEIPDRHSTDDEDPIMRYIRDALGIKL